MKKQNLKKMAKAITLGLVLGTALTAAQPVWAAKTEIKSAESGTGTGIYFENGIVSWGDYTNASGDNATAWGSGTYASGDYATAWGSGATASEHYATAWGSGTTASGYGTTAFGYNTTASGSYATAFGMNTTASGSYSVAFGYNSKAGGQNSLAALGGITGEWEADENGDLNYKSGGKAAVAFGEGAVALKDYTYAIGKDAKANETGSIAIGNGALVEHANSVALGSGSVTGGEYEVSVGSVGSERKITNVAYGVNDHDAATYGQIITGVSYVGDTLTLTKGDGTTFTATISGGSSGGECLIQKGTNYDTTKAIKWGDGATASGNYATAWGVSTEASGIAATAWGASTTASGMYSTAFGEGTEASGTQATAFGYYTTASGGYSTAFGMNTNAEGDASTAFGLLTNAKGDVSTAFGVNTNASGEYSTAFGVNTNAKGDVSTAFGVLTSAEGSGAVSWGGYIDSDGNYYAGGHAKGDASTAFGIKSVANGKAATAFGYGTYAGGVTYINDDNGTETIKEGDIIHINNESDTKWVKVTADDVADGGDYYNMSYGVAHVDMVAGMVGVEETSDDYTVGSGAVAWGGYFEPYNGEWYEGGHAVGKASTAFGEDTIASGFASTAFGVNTVASNYATTAFGEYTTASGDYATAFGSETVASSYYSTAFGKYSKAGILRTEDGFDSREYGVGATAWGLNSRAGAIKLTEYDVGDDGDYAYRGLTAGTYNGNYATAFGDYTVAIGNGSTAFGVATTASGYAATAFGSSNEASEKNSTAFGYYTEASGENSTAFGFGTVAGDYASTAFGDGTVAGGYASTAFGMSTVASGYYSATAFGRNTEASGSYSTAFGYGTVADGYTSTAYGENTFAVDAGTTAWGYGTYAGGITKVDNNYEYIDESIWAGDIVYDSEHGWIKVTDDAISELYTDESGNVKTYREANITKVAAYEGGEYSTAFGVLTSAEGSGAVAWGGYIDSDWNYYAGGHAIGKASTAFGTNTVASGDFSTAFGDSSKAGGINSLAALGAVTGDWSGVTPTGGANAVAIGWGAVAKADNSVAIGQYAVTGLGTKATDGENDIINEFAVGGGTNSGKTYYSQITGVANGVNDHDAVTYGQVKNAVNGLSYDTETKKISYTTIGNSTATELVDLSGLGSGGSGGDTVVGKAGEISVTDGTGADAGKKVIGLASAVQTKLGQVDTNKTNIEALQGVVGDSTSGLVKDVADNKANITSLQGTMGDYSATSGKTYVGKGSVAADLVSLDTAITEFNAQIGNLETTEVVGSGNVTVTKSTQNKKNTYTVALSNNLDLTAAGSVTVGNVSMDNNGFKVGGTKVTGNGISFEGSAVAVTADGINAGGKKITNVAEGTEDSDAATVGQVNRLIGSAGGAYDELSSQVNRLGNRIDKVGAGAAALSALHPLDFDPDNKLTFSAGLGNYRSEKAAAVGMFYRPTDRVMFSMGATMGNDNNMVNTGLSFALDRKIKFSNDVDAPQLGKSSREALVNEVHLLAAENTKLSDKSKNTEKEMKVLQDKIVEQNAKMAEQNARMAQQNARMAEQDARIAKQDKENAEMKEQMKKMMDMIEALKKK